ncbi:hypothetical protein [Burkholderia sp. F1]|uniref:hypothetical protein n=1 Tax=Burkholderia sp. F1 TaxID=3366817 RepID=UPI003D7571B3
MTKRKEEIKRWHAITFMSLIMVPFMIMMAGMWFTKNCHPGDWPGSTACVAVPAIAFAVLAAYVSPDMRKAGSIKELLLCLFMVGGWGMVFGLFALSMLVRVTAHSPRSFEAGFTPGDSAKGCRYRIQFDDTALGKPILLCNRDLGLPNEYVSGVIKVKELVGPYGVRLVDVSVVRSSATNG